MIQDSLETNPQVNEVVFTEQVGFVRIITINRPDARNAVNQSVSNAVGDALESAENDPEVRAIIITGAGDQAFSAGADLKAISRNESVMASEHPEWGFAGYTSHPVRKPTIAAVNGFALGGGMEIVLASDLAVAAENATFGLPEARRGLIAGAGGAFRLANRVAPVVAMEMLLTGEPIDAKKALELHLVNRLVPSGTAIAGALELAEQISKTAPLAAQAHKRIALSQKYDDGIRPHEQFSWAQSDEEWSRLMLSEDSVEGPLAFAEKRLPQWKGR